MIEAGTCSAPFALFDDSGAVAGNPDVAAAAGGRPLRSRLYTGWVHEHVCTDAAALAGFDAAVAADLAAGLHAVVLADYEWGAVLAAASPDEVQAPAGQPGDAPALRCLMFDTLAHLSRPEVDDWLRARDNQDAEPGVAGIFDLTPSVTRAEFDAALGHIDAALRAGDAYQINYTFRLDFRTHGAPLALYRRLRARQPVSFGAAIALPDGRWVLSCSPELFVAYDSAAHTLTARPMKGTAARRADPGADREAGEALNRDAKNRAENLMIVDLLRNDLGRIAQTGSVRVPALFAVEAHPTVWQMTSSVQAQVAPSLTFAAMLRALFPCGSITGAPKFRAMQLIAALESTPRGLYTGALGWLDAPSAAPAGAAMDKPEGAAEVSACGDFCLSVAIRTLVLQPADGDAAAVTGAGAYHAVPQGRAGGCASSPGYTGRMGIGAGIVLDSQPADEYAECYLKARFLTGLDDGLTLFETMRASRAQGVPLLERHVARLAASAQRLGFACDPAAVRAAVSRCCAALGDNGVYRVKLVLARDGTLTLAQAPLAALPQGPRGAPQPVTLFMASALGCAATDAHDPLLAFKSSHRLFYDQAWQRAEARGGFDALFLNTRGELTEGGRSNVFVRLEGRWWTPPLSSGVLPGVLRARLLEDPRWDAGQRVLTLADLQRAQALMVCNALRGAMPARLVHPVP